MEKGTAHCKLPVVKAMIEAGKVRSTLSALAGGAAPGFDFEEIVGVIQALTTEDFYKSMTTHVTTGFGRTCTGPPHEPARFT